MQPLKTGESNFIQSLEIQDILMISSEHQVYSLFNEQSLSVEFDKVDDINVVVEKDFVVFEIEALLEVYDKDTKDDDNGLLVKSKAKYASIYSFNPEQLGMHIEKVDEFAIHFFQYSAIIHVLAYAREYFYSILSRSGYPRLTLPLIKTLVDKDAEEVASKSIQTEK